MIDRPTVAGQHGLVYLAETVDRDAPRVVATSSVFHPDLDPASSAAAQAEIEAKLIRDGWRRTSAQPEALIGVRFER